MVRLARIRGAFTIVELLITLAIIGVLAALLLPAISVAREAGRRTECTNNLKQIGQALLSHEGSHGALPIGAQGKTSFGRSWWVDLLPQLDQASLHQTLDLRSANSGSVLMHGGNARAVDGVVVRVMLCPSSALPELQFVGGVEVMMPSYVGISGSSSHDGFQEKRVNACCLPEGQGEISAGGVLVPNAAIRLSHVLDGVSNAIVVGECAEIAVDMTGRTFRVDGAFPNGWITGTTARGTPPNYNPTFSPPSWNITTIRYPLNMRDYERPGIDDNRGANNPLLSAHPGGVNVLFLGGAVRMLTDETDVTVLRRLATRDDGGLASLVEP